MYAICNLNSLIDNKLKYWIKFEEDGPLIVGKEKCDVFENINDAEAKLSAGLAIVKLIEVQSEAK